MDTGWQEWRDCGNPQKSMGGTQVPHPKTPPRAQKARSSVPPRRSPRENEARANFVYVLERADGVSKIGISNNPRRRRNQISQAGPDRLTIARTLRAGYVAFHVETCAKAMLEPLRIKGEWFRCVPGLAILAVETAFNGSLEARSCIVAELERRRLTIAAERPRASEGDYQKLWAHDAAMRARWPQFMPQLATSSWDDA